MTVQWGILSTAHINRKIIPAIEQSIRGNLLGVAGRDLHKTKTYAGLWKIPRAYGSYDAILADTDIDVIYISLPNHLHTEWIIKSLEAGKHVLCEKPMCLSLKEFHLIKQTVEKTGLHVMEGLMHLHHPQTQFWKSIVDNGELGEVHTISSCFSFRLEQNTENYRWDPAAGGGALWDVGVYPVSLFQYLYGGTPVSGYAFQDIENNVDHTTAALLDFGHGRTAHFFVSFKSSFSTDTIIHGTEGQLCISHPYTNVDICKAYILRDSKMEDLDVPRQYLYSGEIENMHDMILEKKQPVVTLDSSRDVLETILNLKKGNF